MGLASRQGYISLLRVRGAFRCIVRGTFHCIVPWQLRLHTTQCIAIFTAPTGDKATLLFCIRHLTVMVSQRRLRI